MTHPQVPVYGGIRQDQIHRHHTVVQLVKKLLTTGTKLHVVKNL
jgi:hypothetical protein